MEFTSADEPVTYMMNHVTWQCPFEKHLTLDLAEIKNVFRPNYDNMKASSGEPNYWENFYAASPDQYAIPYEEGEVPPFLCGIISSTKLQRLASSILQIRAEFPRATILRLSPTTGITSLLSTLILLKNDYWNNMRATTVSLGIDTEADAAQLIPYHYDFFYNYEHLKNWTYKERDIYNLTSDDDNQQNDIAFVIFPKPPELCSFVQQDFFIPTAKTWELHNTEAFIFAYPSYPVIRLGTNGNIDEESKELQDQFNQVFPLDHKVTKSGKVILKQDHIEAKCVEPPIVGVHTCGALHGMEGGAIVSMTYPCELIGINVSGVQHSEFQGNEDIDYNLFVSVHHPRFVQYYVEKIIPDLLENSKEFLLTNWAKIDAYLHVHGYKLDLLLSNSYRSENKEIQVQPLTKNSHRADKSTNKKKSVILKHRNVVQFI